MMLPSVHILTLFALFAFIAFLVIRFIRRHIVQYYTVRWMFMYTYFLDRNPITEQIMGEEVADSHYHMIGWDTNYMAWWRWGFRSMAADKEMFDTVFKFYKENPPEELI